MIAAIWSLLILNAFSWGATGHRAVGQIAQDNLNARTLKVVSHITEGRSLAFISTWPDEIKSNPSEYKYTFDWHYGTLKSGNDKFEKGKYSGQIIKKLNDIITGLQDKKINNKKKQFYLSFLVHLIGDLHQPLHIGNSKDKGGNDCLVKFHGKKQNLHQLWDEGMINFSKLSYTEMSNRLNFKRVVVKKIDLEKWARESAKIRDDIYPGGKCSKSEIPELSYDYSFTHFPIVEKRIREAGVRLAFTLNKIL